MYKICKNILKYNRLLFHFPQIYNIFGTNGHILLIKQHIYKHTMRVLLIDDDNICLSLMTVFLKKHLKSVNLEMFSNPARALEYIRLSEKNHPDVMIVDLQMHTMNGFSFIDQVNTYFKQTYGTRPPFRIFLHTTFMGPENICSYRDRQANLPCSLKRMFMGGHEKSCKDLSIDACVPKPITQYKVGYMFSDRWPALEQAVTEGRA